MAQPGAAKQPSGQRAEARGSRFEVRVLRRRGGAFADVAFFELNSCSSPRSERASYVAVVAEDAVFTWAFKPAYVCTAVCSGRRGHLLGPQGSQRCSLRPPRRAPRTCSALQHAPRPRRAAAGPHRAACSIWAPCLHCGAALLSLLSAGALLWASTISSDTGSMRVYEGVVTAGSPARVVDEACAASEAWRVLRQACALRVLCRDRC